MSNVDPPFKYTHDESGEYLLPLVAPEPHRLDVVCILEQGKFAFDWRWDRDLDQLVENLHEDEELCERAVNDLRDEFETQVGRFPSNGDLQEWLAESMDIPSLEGAIEELLRYQAIDSISWKQNAFLDELIGGAHPPILRYPANDAMQRQTYATTRRHPIVMDTTILEIYQTSLEPSSYEAFHQAVALLTDLKFEVRQVRLEGLRSFLNSVTGSRRGDTVRQTRRCLTRCYIRP